MREQEGALQWPHSPSEKHKSGLTTESENSRLPYLIVPRGEL